MTVFMEKLLESAFYDEDALIISAPRTAVGKYDSYDGERFMNLFADVTFSSQVSSPVRTVGDFYVENMEEMDRLAKRSFDQGHNSWTSESLFESFRSTAAWIVGAVLREQGRSIASLFGISPELESALAFYENQMDAKLFHISVMGRYGVTEEELDEGVRSSKFHRLPPMNGVVSRLSETTRFHHVCRVLQVPARSEAWSYAIQQLADAHAAGHLDEDALWKLGEASNGMTRFGFKETISMIAEGMPMEYAMAAARAD